jgi:hypothetical protein
LFVRYSRHDRLITYSQTPSIKENEKSGVTRVLVKEMGDLIFKVITSWQVIVVAAAFIAYCFLVNSAARLSHKNRIRRPPMSKKDIQVLPPSGPPANGNNDTVDELGLEE